MYSIDIFFRSQNYLTTGGRRLIPKELHKKVALGVFPASRKNGNIEPRSPDGLELMVTEWSSIRTTFGNHATVKLIMVPHPLNIGEVGAQSVIQFKIENHHNDPILVEERGVEIVFIDQTTGETTIGEGKRRMRSTILYQPIGTRF